MNIPHDTEVHIEARIRAIRGRRRGDADELRAHILDAMDGREVASADAAFEALGDDQMIREAFFPVRPGLPLDRPTIVGIAVAIALLLLSGLLDDGGASCSITGPGVCTATSTGQVADTALLLAAPLLALAAIRWWLVPAALVPAAALLLISLMRLISTASIGADTGLPVLEFVGALLVAVVVIRHVILDRRNMA